MKRHQAEEGTMNNEHTLEIDVNQKRSGGPKTAEGKAIVRMNALRHGILANVIPEHEADAYDEHIKAVHAYYQPLGYLEEALAERIATALWRLGRVVRYESAIIKDSTKRSIRSYHHPSSSADFFLPGWGKDTAPTEPIKYPEHLQGEITELAKSLELHRLGPDELAKRGAEDLQAWVMGAWLYAFELRESNESRYSRAMTAVDKLHGIKKGEADWLERITEDEEVLVWDFTKAAKAVELLMSTSDKLSLPDDWQTVEAYLSQRISTLSGQLKSVLEERTQIQAREAVPSADATAKLTKYEAALERSLYRAMHEIEALQDKRQGKQAPLARMEVHGGE